MKHAERCALGPDHGGPCMWIDNPWTDPCVEAVAAERERIVREVEGLPQGTRTRRHRYTDEEGNQRTDYDRPASVVNDGRINRAAVLAIVRGDR